MMKRLLQSGLIAALLFLTLTFAENSTKNSALSLNLAENSAFFVNLGENSALNLTKNSANFGENFINSKENSAFFVNLGENSTLPVNLDEKNSTNSAEFNATQGFDLNTKEKFVLVNDNILKQEAVAKLNEIGAELQQKSGVTLALAVSIAGLDELVSLKNSLNPPYLLMAMSLLDRKLKVESVGVFTNEEAGKISEKVLEKSVYPLLGQKNPNYAAALFNGYADFADIIATNAKITLLSSVGNANRQTMNIIKIIFYGAICVALLYFFSRRKKKSP